jgi:hypothetical protein
MAKSAVSVHQLEEVLSQPQIRQGFLAEFYCETMFPEIATTEWFDGLECGTRVKIKHEPDFEFKPLEKDQIIEYETPKVCVTEIGVDYSDYAAIKLDDIDAKHLCEYGLFRAEFEKKIRRKANEIVERTIFNHIYKEAHWMNQGKKAGEIGIYDLGSVGSPYEVNPDTLIDFFLFMGGVLDDQCAPDMMRWVAIPKQMKLLFGKKLFDKTTFQGACTMCTDARNGKLFSDLSGFDVYTSNQLPRCIDPITGEITWIIPFGHKEGMGYTMDMSDFEVFRLQKVFGTGIRTMLTYGAGAGRPEVLGYAYITINPNGGV